MKTCAGCGYEFDLASIARDAQLEPVGMQFEDPDHKYDFYYFNHTCLSCGSTILIPVMEFLSYVKEPVPDLVRTGMEDCERHCLRIDDLETCSAPCRYAPFRRLLLQMRDEHATLVASPAPGPGTPPESKDRAA